MSSNRVHILFTSKTWAFQLVVKILPWKSDFIKSDFIDSRVVLSNKLSTVESSNTLVSSPPLFISLKNHKQKTQTAKVKMEAKMVFWVSSRVHWFGERILVSQTTSTSKARRWKTLWLVRYSRSSVLLL